MKKKVLFICVHNSARSQMAEAWLNFICGELFHAQSAGLEPGKINPLVVQVPSAPFTVPRARAREAVTAHSRLFSTVRRFLAAKLRNSAKPRANQFASG